jgi:hypothetical protein
LGETERKIKEAVTKVKISVSLSGVEDLFPLTINGATPLTMTEKEAVPTFETASFI